MKIRAKWCGKYVGVDVLDEDCPGRWCFWIAERIQRHSAAGASGCGSSSSKCDPRCGRRDAQGCPSNRDDSEAGCYKSGCWIKSRGVWKEVPEAKKT